MRVFIVRSYSYSYSLLYTCDTENEMDGDALATLLTVSSGPDCLKELIKKMGVRLRFYQLIKSLCSDETVSDRAYNKCMQVCICVL